ncbi:TfpX/TfpZ family type IV pilin accessory protein [Diaphorobacter sp. C33]|uniref:Fimb protein n=1 Tax=Diaphorobacter nitroreducens TaxID=164759 RepID=A0AAX1WXF9_9BURK|nr:MULTISPECIES: TfpX/TfpZ family type IV pilin accessory protein [unclassified Diaphorobacter]ROR49235.1 hypothetical protein EDC60_1229 [Diaphorobacter nitroreducens]WKK88806.1 TfpX/TfpZ family type IV pilin accessory protein [Diaphorobacter sp. C33]
MMVRFLKSQATARAVLIHFGISACIALLMAFVVFGLWFGAPFRTLAGGLHLFWLLIGVDVVCGPLLTAVLFNPSKSRRELTLDLSLVALLQIAALAYGVYSIALARPVVVAAEVDRFVVVSAVQINRDDLHEAPTQFRKLSWTGPVVLGIRAPRDGDDTLRSIELSLQGMEPSVRPGWWQNYEESRLAVQSRMKPITALRAARPPEEQTAIDIAVQKTGQPMDNIHYMPLVSSKSLDDWIILLDKEANIVGQAPVGGFE